MDDLRMAAFRLPENKAICEITHAIPAPPINPYKVKTAKEGIEKQQKYKRRQARLVVAAFARGRANTKLQKERLAKEIGVTVEMIDQFARNPRFMLGPVKQAIEIEALKGMARAMPAIARKAAKEADVPAFKALKDIAGFHGGPLVQVVNDQRTMTQQELTEADKHFVERMKGTALPEQDGKGNTVQ